MTEPISPADIAYAKNKYIPNEVIEDANELIALNFTAGRAKFTLSELKNLTSSKFGIVKNLKPEWFNIEELYRSQGWIVEFDSPTKNEDYDSFFVFKNKK